MWDGFIIHWRRNRNNRWHRLGGSRVVADASFGLKKKGIPLFYEYLVWNFCKYSWVRALDATSASQPEHFD